MAVLRLLDNLTMASWPRSWEGIRGVLRKGGSGREALGGDKTQFGNQNFHLWEGV